MARDFKVGSLPAGKPGEKGDTGAPGKDATPADFAGEPTTLVAPGVPNQDDKGNVVSCANDAQFCVGGPGSLWRNYEHGYQPVGFWKDKGGVVHLEGLAERISGPDGPNPAAVFILPPAYRPSAGRWFPAAFVSGGSNTPAHLEVGADGKVIARPGDTGIFSLDGVTYRP